MNERFQQDFRDRQDQDPIRRLAFERQEKEELARRLSREASSQWQKAIEGLVAWPAAVTLGVAASALYVAGFLARGFEVFSQASRDVRRNLDESRDDRGLEREIARTAGEAARSTPATPRA
jgi:hypothetical protein